MALRILTSINSTFIGYRQIIKPDHVFFLRRNSNSYLERKKIRKIDISKYEKNNDLSMTEEIYQQIFQTEGQKVKYIDTDNKNPEIIMKEILNTLF